MVQSGANCIAIKDTILLQHAQPRVGLHAFAGVCLNAPPQLLLQGHITNGATAFTSYYGPGVHTAAGQYVFSAAGMGANTNVVIGYKAITSPGCADSVFGTINVLPVPMVFAGADKTILEGGTVLLNASATGSGLSYQWLPAMYLSAPNTLQPTATPPTNLNYTICATNSNGCKNEDSMLVRVLKSLKIPNAFSPNGDGINDTWQIPYLDTYPNAAVQVYDRYGRIVYNSKGYALPWNGTLAGKPLAMGTYYYIVSTGFGRQPVSGSVTIMR